MTVLTSDSGINIEIDNPFGSGGFCYVSEVKDFGGSLNPGYVAKVLKHSQRGKDAGRRVLEEIRLLKKLQAISCIPELLATDENEKEKPWYVMPQYSRLGFARDYADAIRIIKEIALALKSVHSYGIAHRDVKLDNILLDGKGEVVLCDFSISVDKDTPEDLFFYDPVFRRIDVPDEMVRPVGEGVNIDKSSIVGMYQASDVYMLGYCAYQILTRALNGKQSAKTDYFSFEKEVREGFRLMGERLSVALLFKAISGALRAEYKERCSLDSFIGIVEKAEKADCQTDLRILTEVESVKLDNLISCSVLEADHVVYSLKKNSEEMDRVLRIILRGALLMCRGEMIPVYDFVVRNGIVTVFWQRNESFDFGVETLAVYRKEGDSLCLIRTFELPEISPPETRFVFSSRMREAFCVGGLKIVVFNPLDRDAYYDGEKEGLLEKYYELLR